MNATPSRDELTEVLHRASGSVAESVKDVGASVSDVVDSVVARGRRARKRAKAQAHIRARQTRVEAKRARRKAAGAVSSIVEDASARAHGVLDAALHKTPAKPTHRKRKVLGLVALLAALGVAARKVLAGRSSSSAEPAVNDAKSTDSDSSESS
jgi:hypothetical protein